ncbi:restriction endonuclease subunit S [Enterobacter hormaechei]|uniref:restriction endonuclease subunit S n=1 Tax=Enterobacteriaceae TaxID=543 RepID=UPI001A44E952|nr:restriction endonuclease subunit S [Enterobacter hormaechei]MBK4425149.1 restriction endonuclease subunit S [Enterobacter hormaechei]MCE1418683.1 restriction endonuclease subunit S [Enterobacter hormaechei]
MNFDFQQVTIDDAMDAIIDYRGKTPKKCSFGIPLITAKIVKGGSILKPTEFISVDHYDSWMVRGLPDVGDVVLTTEAPLGEVAQLSNRKVALAQRIVTLRGKKGLLHNDYLLYLLQGSSVQNQLNARATGTTVKGIKQSELRKVILNIPSLKYQKWAAKCLQALDKKIEINAQVNQTLEQMAQALFKSWFVDFEPVKAKIAALEAGGSQKDATLAAMMAISGKDTDALAVFEHEHPEQYAELKATAELFPSAMQDSELGEIPEGWNVSNIKDNVDVRDGTHASPKASDSGYHLVTSKNITSGYLDRRSCYYISDADYNDVNKRSRVSCGDILISMIGTVGALYFVAENNVDYAIKNIGLIRTSERHDLQAFIFYHLKSKEGANYIQSRLAGTTQKYLSLKQLREIPLVMPTQDVLAAFNKNTFLHEIHANQEIAETLVNIRDTLLPKLLSGEITLPEAEQTISEAENV